MTKPKRRKVVVTFTQPSLTKQSFRDEANINNIMARYEQTGIVDNITTATPHYGDFSDVTSYQDALNKINAAQALFDALPAQVRQKFENDPTLFLEFAQNPENYETMVAMGLAAPKTPETASEAPQDQNSDKGPQDPANIEKEADARS